MARNRNLRLKYITESKQYQNKEDIFSFWETLFRYVCMAIMFLAIIGISISMGFINSGLQDLREQKLQAYNRAELEWN